jgi:hypothetical protein
MKLFLCWFLVFVGGGLLFAQNARFIELTGKVEVKTAGSAVWVTAAPGMEITRDTVVSTGFKSTARMGLGNSVITIRPLTRLTLEEIAQRGNEEAVDLYLETGRVRAEVTPPSGGKTDFTVRSPSVTASVRGTAFEFDTRQIQVENGLVLFTGTTGQAVYVDAGERSYVSETQSRLIPPFESDIALLTPNLPGLSNTGDGTTGTGAPVVSIPIGPVASPPAPVVPPPSPGPGPGPSGPPGVGVTPTWP